MKLPPLTTPVVLFPQVISAHYFRRHCRPLSVSTETLSAHRPESVCELTKKPASLGWLPLSSDSTGPSLTLSFSLPAALSFSRLSPALHVDLFKLQVTSNPA